jgi:chemotaxis protein CheY-P-specific phosphatase CheC
VSSKKKQKIKSTNDILKILCEGVQTTLSSTTCTDIKYASTFIVTNKTCLRPDIGCFVLFEGGFSGLVAMNFSAAAALEIYRSYYLSMGMPEEELARYHTSPDVADAMGELMNQSVGQFQVMLKNAIGVGVTINQPKMVALSQAMKISLETEVDRPQFRRVEFRTAANHLFYLETTLEKVEFVLDSMDKNEPQALDVEDLLKKGSQPEPSAEAGSSEGSEGGDDVLRQLGL